MDRSEGQRLLALRRERQKKLADDMASGAIEDCASLIPVRFDPTEFEIQAIIYAGLLALGYAVRGEVPTRCGTCAFDLVVYRDDKPIRIIETKKKRAAIGKRKQVRRYAKFGVPVDLVCGMSQARGYVSRVEHEGGFPTDPVGWE